MIKTRLLKNARLDKENVINNELYRFSLMHALSIYSLDAIYTFIPRNACSTLRYSLAISNGFIKGINDINWIHKNNTTFKATQRELAIAKNTFVILRCPFTRVASCFLDTIVDRKIHFNNKNGKMSINFNEFLTIIKSQNSFDREAHWRNQSDFLHYESYDDYFSLEDFKEAIDSLNNRGLKVFDISHVLRNHLSNLKRVDGDFSKMNQEEINKMKQEGIAPTYSSMYSAVEIELVKDIYSDDIDLYKSKFGSNNLLF